LKIRFEPLRKGHDRASFSCGEPNLDDWFRKRALQDERRDIARVFVAVGEADDAIMGFYSLSAFSIELEELPSDLARKLPRYSAIPAVLIGRLARSEAVRGRRVGELLLADAVKRVLGASASLAAYAIVVDAKNDRARAFYSAFGFVSFPESPQKLFLLTATAQAALTAAGK
jgi:GNAT superfamily N-acetyltransferase